MKETPANEPVADTVPKVENAVAVGEDLAFQRKWWRFEHITWIVFGLILVADLCGLFGRGYLAKAERTAADQSIHVDYERIERAGTPSIMTVTLGPQAQNNGHLQLFVSESLITKLGNQRISPQPATSTLSRGGILYTFPMSASPSVVEFAMEPSFPGVQHFTLQVPGSPAVQAHVTVLP